MKKETGNRILDVVYNSSISENLVDKFGMYGKYFVKHLMKIKGFVRKLVELRNEII